MGHPKIDWEFWLAMPYVRVWQAAALSLGIDPDSLANDESDEWEHCNPPDLLSLREFTKRIRLLSAARSDDHFRAGTSRGTPADHDIQLLPAGKWLRDHNRTIDNRLLAAISASLEPLTPIVAEKAKPPWVAIAQDEARRISGNPSQRRLSQDQMGKKIAEKFEAIGIRGRGGVVLSASTIKREALAGIKF